MLLGSYLYNDLHLVNKVEILKKVKQSTRFSLSFLLLLVGSSIVCTLGLLLNSTAIVIGGMIISPLMWPLMQMSLGISYGRPAYIRRALFVLLLATAISLISAYLITYFSPIKNLNDEIIARTTPTLLDLVIALVAGGVAALAITQPKISESLAGVAIAVSLMPPICVSGIGLALSSPEVFVGGLLLYTVNVVAIIFVSILVFLSIGLRNSTEPIFQKRAITLMGVVLFLLSIPLFYFLRQTSFESVAYSEAESVLSERFSEISSSAYVSNVQISTSHDKENSILVEADVLIPEDLAISYEERQQIKDDLEGRLDKGVDLRLRLQNTISILSETDVEFAAKKQLIEHTFVTKLSDEHSNLTVDTLDIYYNEDSATWVVEAVLRGDPNISFTSSDQQNLKAVIEELVDESAEVKIEIISRIMLNTKSSERKELVQQSVQDFLTTLSEDIVVSTVQVFEDDLGMVVDVELKAPANFAITPQIVSLLESLLTEEFEIPVDIKISTIRVYSIQ